MFIALERGKQAGKALLAWSLAQVALPDAARPAAKGAPRDDKPR